MNPSEIPDELVELLDDRAGKKHSREGSVLSTLAEILTRWEQIRRQRVRDEARRNPSMYEQTLADLRAEIGHLRTQHDAALKVVKAAEDWADQADMYTSAGFPLDELATENPSAAVALSLIAAVDEWRASRGQ